MATARIAAGWSERKLTPRFGIELTGQRLDDPDLPQAERDAVLHAVRRHGVCVVPGQDLPDEALIRFACSLGVVMEGKPYSQDGKAPDAAVYRITNIGEDGHLVPAGGWQIQQNNANNLWHIDSTYIKPRHSVSMLFGKEVPPEGADTEYCDLRLFWESLSAEEQASLRGRTAQHSFLQSRALSGFTDWAEEDRARFTPVARPLVETHKPSGRDALCIASHICGISGMTDAEAVALVADLTRRAAVPERCYVHKWRQGDLVLWDNQAVMHRGTPYADQVHRRDMRTVRLIDEEDLAGA